MIEDLSLQRSREILLWHPMVMIGMRIEVSLSMTEPLLISVAIFQMIGDIDILLLLNCFQCIEESHGGIGLGCCSKVESGVSEVKTSFGKTDTFEGSCVGLHHHDRLGICHTDIFTGTYEHPPENELRILSCAYHPGHPIECGIWIAPSNRLDECADNIEVIIALFFIQHDFSLDALLCCLF